MDVVHDQLATERKIRVLTIVDTFTRWASAIEPRFGYLARDVIEVIERVGRERGFPKAIRVDQGSEFVSRELDLWAYQRGVTLDFSWLGKPTPTRAVQGWVAGYPLDGLSLIPEASQGAASYFMRHTGQLAA